ncbi:MAG: alpha/beta fold hydrolase [Haliea sp.]|nr:alpha/beta fold hydrolase [Haliea sp.]
MKTRTWITLLLLTGLALLYAVVIPRAAIFPETQPITMTPADVGLEYEDITLIPADRPLRLAAWWMPADPDTAVATMVFSHGGGSNRHSQFFRALDFYRAMVERGVSVLALDLRNHGESAADGRGLGFGATEKYDARAAIDWARLKVPELPLIAMGISMGGATLIQATSDGAPIDGLILLDPLLDTHATFARGAWTETGLPPSLFLPAAWAATNLWGLPGGAQQAFDRALDLRLPTLLIQDPGDPVTTAEHAKALAAANPTVRLWVAPQVEPDNPELPWRQRWGSHVIAFALFPQQTLEQITAFIESLGH